MKDNFTCQFGYDFFGEALRTFTVEDFSAYLRDMEYKEQIPSLGAFGDSHLRTYFSPEPEPYLSYGLNAHLAYIPGASLTGFGRRHSSKQHFAKIKAYCQYIKPEYIFLKFGQVDFEQGYWYRRIIKGEEVNIRNFFDALLVSYQKAIDELNTFTNIIILNLNPPTIINAHEYAQTIKYFIKENIEDIRIAEIYLKYLPQYIESYKKRLSKIMQFNKYLKNIKGIYKYIDKSSYFMEYGILKKKYRQHDNVHFNISNDERKKITTDLLKEVLY